MQKKASILCVLLLAILGSLASLGRGATQAQSLQQSATPPTAIDLGGSLGLVDAQDRNIRISTKYPTGWRGLRNVERTAAAIAPSADALTGKLQQGQVLLGVTAGRYAINSTYGIQGNIDPASALSVLQVITEERFRNATVGTITEKTFGGNPGAVVAITDARNFGSYISPVQALADYYLIAVIINGYPVVLSATALPGEGAQFHGLLEAMADTVTVTVNVASATPIRPTRTATSVATSGADSSPPIPTLADGAITFPALPITASNVNAFIELGRKRFEVTGAAFRSDGKLIIYPGRNSSVRTILDVDPQTLSITGRLVLDRSIQPSGAISPDGKLMVVGKTRNSAVESHLLDLATGQTTIGFGALVSGAVFAFSPDSKTIAVGGISRQATDSVGVFDTNAGTQKVVLQRFAGSIKALQFSPDGKFLAVGSEDKGLTLVDRATQKRASFPDPAAQRAVTGVSFSRDGSKLVTFNPSGVRTDHTPYHLWETATGKRIATLTHVRPERQASEANAALFSADGSLVITISRSKLDALNDILEFGFWDANTGQSLGFQTAAQQRGSAVVQSVALSPDGRILALSWSNDQAIHFFGIGGGSAGGNASAATVEASGAPTEPPAVPGAAQPSATMTSTATATAVPTKTATVVVPAQVPTSPAPSASTGDASLVSLDLSQHYTSSDGQYSFDYPATLQVNQQLFYPVLAPVSTPVNYTLEIWVGFKTIALDFPQQSGCKIDERSVSASVTQSLETLINCTAADPAFQAKNIQTVTLGGKPAAFYKPTGLVLVNLGNGIPALLRQTIDRGTEDTYQAMLLAIAGSVRLNTASAPTSPPTSQSAIPSQVRCPNAPPSRLTIGGQGRVLPGTPNNLNSKPSRPSIDSTSQKLASIPGRGVFTVLEGPVCNQGITWWKVNYNGTEGWTGESDTKYWVEPTSK